MRVESVNLDVQLDDEVEDEMVYNPSAEFKLKMVQRDRTYDGTQNPPTANFVWKIVKD